MVPSLGAWRLARRLRLMSEVRIRSFSSRALKEAKTASARVSRLCSRLGVWSLRRAARSGCTSLDQLGKFAVSIARSRSRGSSKETRSIAIRSRFDRPTLLAPRRRCNPRGVLLPGIRGMSFCRAARAIRPHERSAHVFHIGIARHFQVGWADSQTPSGSPGRGTHESFVSVGATRPSWFGPVASFPRRRRLGAFVNHA